MFVNYSTNLNGVEAGSKSLNSFKSSKKLTIHSVYSNSLGVVTPLIFSRRGAGGEVRNHEEQTCLPNARAAIL